MRVLITGAFGNLGLMCVDQALDMGFHVVCFDLDTAANRKLAQAYVGKIEACFGDIRDERLIAHLVDGVDAIIHNASVLPPITEDSPKLAREINVDACKGLIDQAMKQQRQPVFIFPSSVTVFGMPDRVDVRKTAEDPVHPTDNYTHHKLEIENYLQENSLPFVVLRVGVSVDARTIATDRATFKKLLSVRADNPVEYVHPKDVAYAMCKAVSATEVSRQVLLIGGGPDCQLSQRQFLSAAFNSLGLKLPSSVHGENAFYTHWMDTEFAQMHLQYQRHSFNDYVKEMDARLGVIRRLLWPLRPLLNFLIGPLLKAL